jgi:hypothetical protein
MTATDLPDDDWTLPRVRDWINDRFRRGIYTECPVCDLEIEEEIQGGSE